MHPYRTFGGLERSSGWGVLRFTEEIRDHNVLQPDERIDKSPKKDRGGSKSDRLLGVLWGCFWGVFFSLVGVVFCFCFLFALVVDFVLFWFCFLFFCFWFCVHALACDVMIDFCCLFVQFWISCS